MSLTVEKYGDIYPAIWEICDECRGNGHYANRAFDGFSSSDYSYDNPFMDQDFVDDYVAGRYDVRCGVCDGSGKVLMPDFSRCTEEQITKFNNDALDEAEMNAIQRAEMRLGY